MLKKYQEMQITYRLNSKLNQAFKNPTSASIMMVYRSSDAAFSVDTMDEKVLLPGN